MKTTKPNWNVKKLSRMAKTNELRFDYPIQRAGGQWDILQKSLLIHSIAGDYPVPPIAVVKANLDGKDDEFVIDGKQRTTNVLDFIAGIKDKEGHYPANAYKLHADTPEVEIEGITEPIELSGKYFDELHEDVQAEILSANFQIQRMEDATDEEIEELFSRWNNGTPLTKQQKARGKMGTANAIIIDKLQKHAFMTDIAQFTPLQRRRSEDEGVILQTLMLVTKSEEEFTSFVANDILKFATEMRDADITDATNAVKDGLDYLLASGITSAIFKKLHLPTVILTAKKALDEDIDMAVFSAWVEDFAISLRNREKAIAKSGYKQWMGAGSVKKNNVLGRKKEMIKHFESFLTLYKPEAPESKPEAPIVPEAQTPEAPITESTETPVVASTEEDAIAQAELDKALQNA